MWQDLPTVAKGYGRPAAATSLCARWVVPTLVKETDVKYKMEFSERVGFLTLPLRIRDMRSKFTLVPMNITGVPFPRTQNRLRF